MSAMKIKKGDLVRVITGKDKDKEGKVMSVNAKNNTVLVISNVMLVVDGQITRVGFKIEDGKKVRVAKATGKAID